MPMKYALIIGSDKYEDPKLAQLKTPAADSQALAKVLDDKTIGGFDEVKSLINQTETTVRRAVSAFLTNKKPDDLVLLYFSGHGVLDDRGRLYLALKDTQVNLLKATSIPSAFLADEMDSCRSKRQILILDCCHSGAFARGTKGEQKAITETTFEGSGFGRVVLMEGIFLLVFTQWYANRYFHWGRQLPFPVMIALILALWGLIVGAGWWLDRKSARKSAGRRA